MEAHERRERTGEKSFADTFVHLKITPHITPHTTTSHHIALLRVVRDGVWSVSLMCVYYVKISLPLSLPPPSLSLRSLSSYSSKLILFLTYLIYFCVYHYQYYSSFNCYSNLFYHFTVFKNIAARFGRFGYTINAV